MKVKEKKKLTANRMFRQFLYDLLFTRKCLSSFCVPVLLARRHFVGGVHNRLTATNQEMDKSSRLKLDFNPWWK